MQASCSRCYDNTKQKLCAITRNKSYVRLQETKAMCDYTKQKLLTCRQLAGSGATYLLGATDTDDDLDPPNMIGLELTTPDDVIFIDEGWLLSCLTGNVCVFIKREESFVAMVLSLRIVVVGVDVLVAEDTITF